MRLSLARRPHRVLKCELCRHISRHKGSKFHREVLLLAIDQAVSWLCSGLWCFRLVLQGESVEFGKNLHRTSLVVITPVMAPKW